MEILWSILHDITNVVATLTIDDFSCSVDKCRIQVEGFLVSKPALLASSLSALVLRQVLDLVSLVVGAAQTCTALHRQTV